MKYLVLFFLLFTNIFAESLDFREILQSRKDVKYIKLLYISRPNDNLANIYKKFVKDESIISKNEEMVAKTINANPKITDWNTIPVKSKVLVYLDVDFIDLEKVEAYNKNVAELTRKLREALLKKEQEKPKTNGFKGSLFYMASYGKFSQSNPALADISFLQNSPISLGLSASYYPLNPKFSYSSSLYFSYLLSAASNLGVESVTVPTEIGGNFYTEYKAENFNFSLYGGIDFERFHTFNLEGIQQERKIYFDTNDVLYLTVGLSRKLKIYKWDLFSKLSFSQSIVSSMTPGYTDAQITEAFSGNKILFYLFKRYNEKIFMHTMFKYHFMSGPSDITTLRIGVGFGYLLF